MILASFTLTLFFSSPLPGGQITGFEEGHFCLLGYLLILLYPICSWQKSKL